MGEKLQPSVWDDLKATSFQSLCPAWVVASQKPCRWISLTLLLPTVHIKLFPQDSESNAIKGKMCTMPGSGGQNIMWESDDALPPQFLRRRQHTQVWWSSASRHSGSYETVVVLLPRRWCCTVIPFIGILNPGVLDLRDGITIERKHLSSWNVWILILYRYNGTRKKIKLSCLPFSDTAEWLWFIIYHVFCEEKEELRHSQQKQMVAI